MEEEQNKVEIRVGDAVFVGEHEHAQLWAWSAYAPYWFADALHEARIQGPDARRREIVFAVCVAESCLFEWVQGKVLRYDFSQINNYFRPGNPRNVRDRWKEVLSELFNDGKIKAAPDWNQSFWVNFCNLIDMRNGLVHGGASRAETTQQSRDEKPYPSIGDLRTMDAGWPTRVVVSLVKELHNTVGTPPPTWLVDP